MVIRVQREDFAVGDELERLAAGNYGIGAVVSFVGLVRDVVGSETPLVALELEHYPAMVDRQLAALEAEALQRWPLAATLIIHRFGRLLPGERIVLVAVASAHREAAFSACQFLIDWLKTRAPFWKTEETSKGVNWVGAKEDDDAAARRWLP